MIRVRTQFTVPQGGPYLSTMYFGTAAATATQAEADAAVAATGAFWNTVKGAMGTTVSYATLTEVAQLDVDGTLTGLFTTTPQTGTGVVAAQLLPYASQALVRWATGSFVAGKQIKGRTFIPGITKNGDTDGKLDGPTQTLIQGAANTLNGVTTPPLVVWSKRWALTATVSSASVWNQFAVLRSRRD